jgi:hypothetical protein
MKSKVSEVGAETIDDLIDIIVDVSEALTPQELAHLTNSMQSRFQAVIAANGDKQTTITDFLTESPPRYEARKGYPYDRLQRLFFDNTFGGRLTDAFISAVEGKLAEASGPVVEC